MCRLDAVVCSGKANKFDVVMIDTAGRMQDNAPLMRALAKVGGVSGKLDRSGD